MIGAYRAGGWAFDFRVLCDQLGQGFEDRYAIGPLAERIGDLLPAETTRDEGRAYLCAIIDAEIARLCDLKASRLDAAQAAHLARAKDAVLIDTSRAGEVRRRYEGAASRELRQLRKDLIELQSQPVVEPRPPDPGTMAPSKVLVPPVVAPEKPAVGSVPQPADEPLDLDAALAQLGREIAEQRVRLDANQAILDQERAEQRE
jgi:hypothetical protein